MRKIKKVLGVSVFMFILSLSFGFVAKAGYINFTESTPIMQGWKNLSVERKEKSSDMSGVVLSRKDNNAYDFQVRGKNSSGKWNSWYKTTVVNAINQNFIVNYDNNYGTGTEVQARFRNHSWNMNTGTVIGTWNYQ